MARSRASIRLKLHLRLPFLGCSDKYCPCALFTWRSGGINISHKKKSGGNGRRSVRNHGATSSVNVASSRNNRFSSRVALRSRTTSSSSPQNNHTFFFLANFISTESYMDPTPCIYMTIFFIKIIWFHQLG